MTRIHVINIVEAVEAIQATALPFELRIPGNVATRAFMHMLSCRRLGVSFADANYNDKHVIVVSAQKPKQARYWQGLYMERQR